MADVVDDRASVKSLLKKSKKKKNTDKKWKKKMLR